MKKKLKIGILLNGYDLPAWQYKIIEELTLSDFAGISLVVRNLENGPAIQTHYLPVPYSLHRKADRLIFGNKYDYDRVRNIEVLIRDIPEICAGSILHGRFEDFLQETLDEIRSYDLDIILKFGFGLLTGKILKVPGYGVWSYTMDNFGTQKEGTSGYYEVVMKRPVTRSELVILREADENHIVISYALEATCSYSIQVNRNRMFWTSLSNRACGRVPHHDPCQCPNQPIR